MPPLLQLSMLLCWTFSISATSYASLSVRSIICELIFLSLSNLIAASLRLPARTSYSCCNGLTTIGCNNPCSLIDAASSFRPSKLGPSSTKTKARTNTRETFLQINPRHLSHALRRRNILTHLLHLSLSLPKRQESDFISCA
jgi:hypothetical protein